MFEDSVRDGERRSRLLWRTGVCIAGTSLVAIFAASFVDWWLVSQENGNYAGIGFGWGTALLVISLVPSLAAMATFAIVTRLDYAGAKKKRNDLQGRLDKNEQDNQAEFQKARRAGTAAVAELRGDLKEPRAGDAESEARGCT